MGSDSEFLEASQKVVTRKCDCGARVGRSCDRPHSFSLQQICSQLFESVQITMLLQLRKSPQSHIPRFGGKEADGPPANISEAFPNARSGGIGSP